MATSFRFCFSGDTGNHLPDPFAIGPIRNNVPYWLRPVTFINSREGQYFHRSREGK
jgi:hypothetical protein